MNKHLLIVTVIFFLLVSGCSKDDDRAPIDKLPPATQTGANTFGCLVNGKAFIDADNLFNCYYQYVDGGYYFGIQGENTGFNPSSISIRTNNRTISENEILLFSTDELGNACASAYFRISEVFGEFARTNLIYTGELTITKMDQDTHIVSGTFWFDVQHPVTGETVEIREGRFDTRFTT